MQCACELPRVVRTLGGRVAAAHDGQAACGGKGVGSPYRSRPDAIQHQGRIFRLQQGLRVAPIAQRQEDPCGPLGRRALEPRPGGLQLLRQTGRNQAQGLRLGGRHALRQRALGLLKNDLRKTEGRQKAAGGAVANARRQRQAQPAGKFIAFHGAGGEVLVPEATARGLRSHPYSGLIRRSPTRTPVRISRIKA